MGMKISIGGLLINKIDFETHLSESLLIEMQSHIGS